MLLLLNLSVFVCFAQSPVTQPPVNPHSKNLSVKQYDQLISYYRYLKPDSAAYLAKVALELAIKTHDDNGHALILNQIGMIDDNLGKVDESHQKYIEARDIYLRTGQKTGLATELVRLGVIESRKGNYDKAIGYYLDALKASEQSGNLKGKMESYLTLGEAYLGQNKLDTALNYLKLAENINNTIPFSNLTLNIYDEFGVIYGKQGKYALSKAYLEKGIALSNKPQYQGLNITLTNSLAAVYAKQGFKDTSIRLQKSALAKSITTCANCKPSPVWPKPTVRMILNRRWCILNRRSTLLKPKMQKGTRWIYWAGWPTCIICCIKMIWRMLQNNNNMQLPTSIFTKKWPSRSAV